MQHHHTSVTADVPDGRNSWEPNADSYMHKTTFLCKFGDNLTNELTGYAQVRTLHWKIIRKKKQQHIVIWTSCAMERHAASQRSGYLLTWREKINEKFTSRTFFLMQLKWCFSKKLIMWVQNSGHFYRKLFLMQLKWSYCKILIIRVQKSGHVR